MRPLDNVGPKLTKTFDTACARAPERRIAYEQSAGKYTGPRLQQGIEIEAITREGIGRRRQVDLLPGQNLEL